MEYLCTLIMHSQYWFFYSIFYSSVYSSDDYRLCPPHLQRSKVLHTYRLSRKFWSDSRYPLVLPPFSISQKVRVRGKLTKDEDLFQEIGKGPQLDSHFCRRRNPNIVRSRDTHFPLLYFVKKWVRNKWFPRRTTEVLLNFSVPNTGWTSGTTDKDGTIVWPDGGRRNERKTGSRTKRSEEIVTIHPIVNINQGPGLNI